MVDIVNMVGWDAHSHVLLFLEVANRDPSGHLAECADGADVAEDESHKTTDETTVSPAGGLESGPEVAIQTTFARLAVIQKKTVSATHPIIVEVVNDGHLEMEGSLIDGRGECRKDIMDLPNIKIADFLILTEPLGDGQVVEGIEGRADLRSNVRA